MIPWWRTDFGEADIVRVSEAIRARHISQGPVTREFEARLAETLGVPYVVCTTSGTTALTMALLAAGIGHGDEVIVPDRTWIATAHAVMMTGAKVRLVDVDGRGLLPVGVSGSCIHVNLNGRLTDGVGGLEDSCQAFPQPPRGLAACYSMSTAKLLPTGQGGFVATRDEGFYRELLSLRTHDVPDAMVPAVLTWRRFGYNFRYNDILASIGLVQLAQVPEKIERLREIHAEYLRQGIPVQPSPLPLYNELFHMEPERLRAYLLSRGIQARPFYPSLHTAPYLHATGEFPNSERFSHGLTLPSGPAQTDADIQYTIGVLHDFR